MPVPKIGTCLELIVVIGNRFVVIAGNLLLTLDCSLLPDSHFPYDR